MTLKDNKPVEIWLTKTNIAVTCSIVFEDETGDHLDVDSLSMRGAQREMTSWMIGQGYEPADRWNTEEEDEPGGEVLESSRTFRPARKAPKDVTADVVK